MAASTSTFTIDSVVASGLQDYTRQTIKVALEHLSGNFGFDAEQIPVMVDYVMRKLESPEIERVERPVKKAKKAKKETEPKAKKPIAKKVSTNDKIPKITLPWCGEVIDGCCHAITSNQDLYTQCTKDATDGEYCTKHASKRPCGTVEDRLKCDIMEYRDPTNNKKVKPFSVYIAKKNVDVDAAKAEAERLGWTIDPVQFEEYVVKRGRPKKASTPKSAAISDTDTSGSETEMSPKPKKRGRPKKVAVDDVKSSGPDLIAQKMKEVAIQKEGEKKEVIEVGNVEVVEEDNVDNGITELKEATKFGSFKMREVPKYSPNADLVKSSMNSAKNIEDNKKDKNKLSDATERTKQEKKEEKKCEEFEKKVAELEELCETEPESECETENEEEGITTEEWDAPDGNTYLVDDENNVYDYTTQEVIGTRVDGELVELEE